MERDLPKAVSESIETLKVKADELLSVDNNVTAVGKWEHTLFWTRIYYAKVFNHDSADNASVYKQSIRETDYV